MRLFEERLYRRAYARAQGPRAALHLAQIDSQLRRLGVRGGADTTGFYRDPYFNAYVLGVLESVTKFYETETRRFLRGLSLQTLFMLSRGSGATLCTGRRVSGKKRRLVRLCGRLCGWPCAPPGRADADAIALAYGGPECAASCAASNGPARRGGTGYPDATPGDGPADGLRPNSDA
jgi:hypothetical protein